MSLESQHLEEDQKSILKARRSRVQVYLLIGIESKVDLSYVTPYLKRKMKKKFFYMHLFVQNWGGKDLCSCLTITLEKHIEY